jgi:superfamily II DNA helicase RecQ
MQIESSDNVGWAMCLAGVTRVICATIAFGLGMELLGVGLIVHWDAATSLQEYVQQIGRGAPPSRAVWLQVLVHYLL